jgi:hypothetical protein
MLQLSVKKSRNVLLADFHTPFALGLSNAALLNGNWPALARALLRRAPGCINFGFADSMPRAMTRQARESACCYDDWAALKDEAVK